MVAQFVAPTLLALRGTALPELEEPGDRDGVACYGAIRAVAASASEAGRAFGAARPATVRWRRAPCAMDWRVVLMAARVSV